jgi:hypothetical protein
MECPDLFQWADWLSADTADDENEAHLRQCAGCAARVGALRGTVNVELPIHDHGTLTADICFESYPYAPPSVGDVWLSARNYSWDGGSYRDLDQLMFVVVNENVCEQGRRWLDVAPLSTNVELATDRDLVFQTHHSTLNMQLACLPHHQLYLAWEQFDSKVGEIVEDAFNVLVRSLSATAPAEWTGTAYDSAYDPRLDVEQQFLGVVERLREPYLSSLNDAVRAIEASPENTAGEDLQLFIPLLHELRHQQAAALAAASRAASEALLLYDEAHLFEAKLQIDVFTDLLRVEIAKLQDQWIDSICLMVKFAGDHVVAAPLRHGTLEFGPADAHGLREISEVWLGACDCADA